MAKKTVSQYLPHRPKVGAVVPFRDVREGQWFTSGPADRRPWRMDGGRAVRRLQSWGESARFAADHYVKVVPPPRARARVRVVDVGVAVRRGVRLPWEPLPGLRDEGTGALVEPEKTKRPRR